MARNSAKDAALAARIADLELRVKQLEARLRMVGAQAKTGPTLAPGARKSAKAIGRPRPRCPGCTLELPKGRRKDSCVWCGFRFEAVGRAFR